MDNRLLLAAIFVAAAISPVRGQDRVKLDHWGNTPVVGQPISTLRVLKVVGPAIYSQGTGSQILFVLVRSKTGEQIGAVTRKVPPSDHVGKVSDVRHTGEIHSSLVRQDWHLAVTGLRSDGRISASDGRRAIVFPAGTLTSRR